MKPKVPKADNRVANFLPVDAVAIVSSIYVVFPVYCDTGAPPNAQAQRPLRCDQFNLNEIASSVQHCWIVVYRHAGQRIKKPTTCIDFLLIASDLLGEIGFASMFVVGQKTAGRYRDRKPIFGVRMVIAPLQV